MTPPYRDGKLERIILEPASAKPNLGATKGEQRPTLQRPNNKQAYQILWTMRWEKAYSSWPKHSYVRGDFRHQFVIKPLLP